MEGGLESDEDEIDESDVESIDETEKELFFTMTKHYPDYSKVNSDNWKFATIGNLLEDAGNKLKLTLASHYEAFARDDNDVGECQFLTHTVAHR